jgi:hypothetical protein
VQIGKHSLVIGESTARPVAAPMRAASDAWDAAQTYYGVAPAEISTQQAPAPGAADDAEELLLSEALEDAETEAAAAELPVPGEAIDPEADLFSAEAGALDAPDPDGAFAFGEEDLFPDVEPVAGEEIAAEEAAGTSDEAGDELLEPVTDPMPAATGGEHTALFEFGRDSDLGQSDPSQRRAAAAVTPPPAPGPVTPVQHAGILVQRSGQLVNVYAWEGAEVLVGRATECHLPLPHPGVSRRHALFVRVGDAFEVRDLDSVNGLAVNGARVQRHVLQVGDVVRIEDFELTFVLDTQPIGEGVVAPKRAAAADEVDPGHHTQLAAAPLEEAEPALAHEDVLTSEEDVDAEEKEEAAAVTAVRLSQRSAAPPLPALAERLQVELEIAVDELPVALRTALETLAQDGDAVVPVKLRVRVR